MRTGEGFIGRVSAIVARLLGRQPAPTPPPPAPPRAEPPRPEPPRPEPPCTEPPCPEPRALPARIAVLALTPPAGPAVDQAENDAAPFLRALLDAGFFVVLAASGPAPLVPLRRLIAAEAIPAVTGPAGEFALWRAAMGAMGLPRADTSLLLLASTRLRGPFAPLGPLIDGFDFAAADLWGLTESWVGQYHLAPGFLGAGPRALAHPAWAAFWSALPSPQGRPSALPELDIALTQTLLGAGLTAAAAYPYQTLLDRAGAAFAGLREAAALAGPRGAPPELDQADRNRLAHLRRVRTLQANRTPMEPLSFFWEELLDLGAPFVSRELLGRNPHGIVTAASCAERVRRLAASPPRPSAAAL